MSEIESSVFLVQFSSPYIPEGSSKPWNRNYDIMVIAPSLERAVAAVRERYPEATLHAVNRRGTEKTVMVVE